MLPETVDVEHGVTARFENGMLYITLNKTEKGKFKAIDVPVV